MKIRYSFVFQDTFELNGLEIGMFESLIDWFE